jgi:hypothetical protein
MSIYFIQAGDDGPIKIGVTGRSIHKRLAGIKTGCPWPLRLLGEAPGDFVQEQVIHLHLVQFRMEGEWFWPDPAVHATLADLQAGTFQPKFTRQTLKMLHEWRGTPAPQRTSQITIQLPADLSNVIRSMARCAEMDVDDLIIDVLRDAFGDQIARQRPFSNLSDEQALASALAPFEGWADLKLSKSGTDEESEARGNA